uniref:RNA-dependent RNA polymerase n=1 Tax=Feline picobirnavirus TaxID=1417758 RepID=A0A220VZ50_9VIRU|nr:RNA-dependent RNA polymerase [Feline picobirnavirus]
MPKNYEIRFDQFFELPNNGLRSYFGNVVKGQSKVYDTPFAKGETTEALLQGWMKQLESIGDRWPTLLDFEKDLASKVGPMSVMKPLKERMTDIDHYYDDILLSSEPIFGSAINAVVSEWKGAGAVGLHLRSQSETVKLMKKSTNSGSPYFIKRRNAISQTMPVLGVHVHGDVPYQYLNNGYDNWLACAILGWRGQEGGYSKDDVKQRVVWMFPFAVNIKELQLYQPLIETAQKFDLVPAWTSMESVDKAVTQLFDTKGSDDLVVCTDFSKFDQHFNGSLQTAAKSILQQIFTSRQDSDWFKNVFDIKYMIPLAYNWDKIRYGRHGMASGSGGTNADETLAHRALQYEAAQRSKARLNPNSQCLGDDGILSYPGITVEDVIASYTKHGLEMNESKQYASKQDCVYLRRWHHEKYRVNGICVGVYSTCRALGRLRYLERFMDPEVWGPRTVALRQLSIIENVKYHPMRNEFVEYCMKRDKYRLGLDIPGFLDSIEEIAREAIDQMPDFMGYTKTLQTGGKQMGISNWWIVQYLKSK